MGAGQGLTYLFYDGRCGLCQGVAGFVARREQTGELRCAPLGGATFERLIPPQLRAGLPDSLVVRTQDGELLVRSEAALHLLGRMGPAWRLLGLLAAWLPKGFRDRAYALVARWRPAGRACAADESRRDGRFEP
jgi:predicted DCC family thiol-disulfide oxidoreductase YuxK